MCLLLSRTSFGSLTVNTHSQGMSIDAFRLEPLICVTEIVLFGLIIEPQAKGIDISPFKFLIISRQRTFGLTIPAGLLAIVDEMIE